jgi:outer membrane protein TolC
MHFQQEAGLQQFRQQELDLESAARQASLNMQTAEENLQELPVQTRAARNVYDQKIAQYKAGIISLIDLTNAAFVLYRSQYDFSVAISDWWLARLDRAVATGNLELFIQRFNP